MNKNPLQWNEVGDSSGTPGTDVVASSDSTGTPAVDTDLAKDLKLAEVLKSIGQDCTQQIESYLERCETNQEGE